MLEINKFDRIIVANWKLNGSIDFIEQYLQELNCSKLENSNNCGIICTPSVYFQKLVGRLNPLFLGGQDCSNYSEGAYTGEVSATMLKDASCQFCIIGHSERRQIFGQSNEDVCIKAMNLIANNINPIICIGETFEEKNQNLTKDIIYTQISKSVPKNATKDFVIIAYEPIWAIGTGKIPSLEEIDNIHSFIKNEIQNTIVKNGPKNPLSKIELPMGFPASFESGIIKKRDNEWPHYLSEAEVIDYRLTKAVTVKSGWSSIDLLRSFIDNSCQDILDNKQQKTRFIISSTGSIEVIKVRNKHQSHVVSVLSNLGGPQKANSELSNLGIIFKDYPKPTQLIRYFEEMNEGRDFTTLDFFSGSGTTAHATMDANRKDDGQRKFIVAEMNDYFETIILPRVKKVNFASEWKEGKAQNRDGYGGIFQYIELEQYDDIIDKLQVVDDADYSKSESCYIYEPDKNQINFRMEKELIDPLSETAHFDLFHSLLFHHGLALVTVSLDDDVLFAQCLNKQGKTCAIVLSSDDDKAKAKVASLGSDYTEVFANVRTPGATRIVADLFKG